MGENMKGNFLREINPHRVNGNPDARAPKIKGIGTPGGENQKKGWVKKKSFNP